MNKTNWEKQYFERLEERLDDIFPKTNQDNPEIPSKGNRSGAITFNAYANIIFKDILEKAILEHKENILKEIEKKKTDSADLFGEAVLWKDITKLLKKL